MRSNQPAASQPDIITTVIADAQMRGKADTTWFDVQGNVNLVAIEQAAIAWRKQNKNLIVSMQHAMCYRPNIVVFDNRLETFDTASLPSQLFVRKRNGRIVAFPDAGAFCLRPHSTAKCLWEPLARRLFVKKGLGGYPRPPECLTLSKCGLEQWILDHRHCLPRGTGSISIYWQWIADYNSSPLGQSIREERQTLLHRFRLSRQSTEIVIVIMPRQYMSKHFACFRVLGRKGAYKKSTAMFSDAVCSCCDIFPNSLIQPKFSSTLHRATPMTVLSKLWPKETLRWIQSQHEYCQYVLSTKEGWQYLDYFDCTNQATRWSFDNFTTLWNWICQRHESLGKKKKRRDSQRVRERLSNKTDLAGTWSRLERNLSLAVDSIHVVYNCHSPQQQIADAEKKDIGHEIASLLRTKIHVSTHRLNQNDIYGYRGKGWKLDFVSQCIGGGAAGQPVPHHQVVSRLKEWFDCMRRVFDSEVISGRTLSPAQVTYHATLFYMACAHPLNIGLSKPSLALTRLFKQRSMHQLYFTSTPFLKAGEAMSPRHNSLKSVWTGDISLCYSSILAKQSVPNGAPLVFTNLAKQGRGDRLWRHGSHPYSTGEYRIIRALVKDAMTTKKTDILMVFSQYSFHGSFIAAGKSLDLLLVMKSAIGRDPGRNPLIFRAFQIHHNYTHGCDTCPVLSSYAQKQDLERVRRHSDAIDAFWKNYCKEVLDCQLDIVYFCHPFSIGNALFNSVAGLPAPGDSFERVWLSQRRLPRNKLSSLCRDRSLCVFIIGQGRQERMEDDEDAAVATKTSEGKLVLAAETAGPTLFTGPQLLFLIKAKAFRLTHVHHVIVYRCTNAFRPLLSELTRLRTLGDTTFATTMLKLSCNSMIGMLGSNVEWADHVTLVPPGTSYKPTSWHSKYTYTLLEGGTVRVSRLADIRRPTTNMLPVYVWILAEYRFNLVSFLEFVRSTLQPGTWRTMQVRADAITLGLSTPTLTRAARDSRNFVRRWKTRVAATKTPGFFTTVNESTLFSLAPGMGVFAPGVMHLAVGQDCGGPTTWQDRLKYLTRYNNNHRRLNGLYGKHLPHLLPPTFSNVP